MIFIFVIIIKETSSEHIGKTSLTFFSKLSEPDMIAQVVFRAQWDAVIEPRY
jgi:hypothetical protein